MLHVTQLRGAQSGGGAVKVGGSEPRQIIAKCVNAKRSDLASRLAKSMLSAGRARAWDGSFFGADARALRHVGCSGRVTSRIRSGSSTPSSAASGACFGRRCARPRLTCA